MEQHNRADENYCLEASRLLELSTKAHGLFESSNVDLKRKLLTFILQNSKLAPRVGLEPTTPRLHLPQNFFWERTISSSTWDVGR